jgi:hypothetical protein
VERRSYTVKHPVAILGRPERLARRRHSRRAEEPSRPCAELGTVGTPSAGAEQPFSIHVVCKKKAAHVGGGAARGKSSAQSPCASVWKSMCRGIGVNGDRREHERRRSRSCFYRGERFLKILREYSMTPLCVLQPSSVLFPPLSR